MNEKTNYLIICDSAEINGGCAKVAIQTAVGLARSGKKVIFFVGGGKDNDLLIHPNIEIINLKMDSLISGNKFKMLFTGIYNYKSKKELSALLSKLDLNNLVIHIHSWVKTLSPSIFTILKKFDCKFYITIHDYFLVCPNGGLFNYPKCKICKLNKVALKCLLTNCDSRNYIYKIWRWIKFKVQKKCLRNCKYDLIDISSFTEKYVKISEQNRYLVRNPIEMNQEVISLNGNRLAYAFIGRLTEEKGINLFCKAMAIGGYEAYIYGSGYLEKKLKEMYKDYKNIHFVGWVDSANLKYEYDKIKALIFPSMWYEGAPLSIPEIQSYGIPCIVSDACSGKDYIVEGINGYTFKNNNLESLLEKIKLLETNLLKDLDVEDKISKLALEMNNDESQYIEKLMDVYAKRM